MIYSGTGTGSEVCAKMVSKNAHQLLINLSQTYILSTRRLCVQNPFCRGLFPNDLAVDFNPREYSRISLDAEQERSIEESWAEKKKTSPQARFQLNGFYIQAK